MRPTGHGSRLKALGGASFPHRAFMHNGCPCRKRDLPSHFLFEVIAMDVRQFLRAVLDQDEPLIRSFFHQDAVVNWHCTNEHFQLDEYIVVNCEYPGSWDGVVERIEELDNLYITVTRVYPIQRTGAQAFTSCPGSGPKMTESFPWMNTGRMMEKRPSGEGKSTSGHRSDSAHLSVCLIGTLHPAFRRQFPFVRCCPDSASIEISFLITHARFLYACVQRCHQMAETSLERQRLLFEKGVEVSITLCKIKLSGVQSEISCCSK